MKCLTTLVSRYLKLHDSPRHNASKPVAGCNRGFKRLRVRRLPYFRVPSRKKRKSNQLPTNTGIYRKVTKVQKVVGQKVHQWTVKVSLNISKILNPKDQNSNHLNPIRDCTVHLKVGNCLSLINKFLSLK